MMKKTKPRLWICVFLLIVCLGVIWGNSMTPGQLSGQLSGWASALLGKLFPFLAPDSEYGHLLVRKLAHFSEFTILGILLRWLFAMLIGRKLPRFLLPLGCGMVCAVIDECIQIFSPGRVCSFFDMCIDWGGVLTGVGMLSLLFLLIVKKGTRK